MLIDTHTHLYLEEFAPDNTAAVDRAVEAGVDMMIMPNVDLSTIAPMRDLHERRPEVTAMAMGLHPTEIKEDYTKCLDEVIRHYLDNRSDYVAIGEVGIDLYWDQSFRRQQKDAFRIQAELAASENLPLIIHCREGLDDTVEILSRLNDVPAAVFHSFGGSLDDLSKINDIGDFYIGINGIITFKNSGLRNVLPSIDRSRLLLETDSPYLAPVPHRGKRNQSSYIVHTAAYIASILDESVEGIAEMTSANACTLFKRVKRA